MRSRPSLYKVRRSNDTRWTRNKPGISKTFISRLCGASQFESRDRVNEDKQILGLDAAWDDSKLPVGLLGALADLAPPPQNVCVGLSIARGSLAFAALTAR